MENEVIGELQNGEMTFGFGGELDPIKVSIHQFYGIEINDFAVAVSKAALWIAESQALQETENIVHTRIDFLPLKSYANIVEGNAIRIDWGEVIPKEKCSYIIGNPPFVGKKEQSTVQKEETKNLIGVKVRGVGNLDYVSNWYIKAIRFIKDTKIKCAFVSTNSITQGEQVPILWSELLRQGIDVSFAYRPFRWDSESKEKAHVHVVIIGFVHGKFEGKKKIFSDKAFREVKNISPYIVDAPNVAVSAANKSICGAKPMQYGNMPIDKGHLILTDEERKILLANNPNNAEFIRRYIGGDELINKTNNWCLWLYGIDPQKFFRNKIVMTHIDAVKEFRLSSNRPQTLKAAETPYLFGEIRQPKDRMLAVPKVSSENRRYIPMAFVEPDTIVSGSLLFIAGAGLYEFGILTSNVHNAWMRAVAGRLESRYQYSASVVYNTFPWPKATDKQKATIKEAAKEILTARKKYPQTSYAALYGATMPPELRKAHQANDRAVMAAYGFSVKDMTEASCVAELMKMYKELTKKV